MFRRRKDCTISTSLLRDVETHGDRLDKLVASYDRLTTRIDGIAAGESSLSRQMTENNRMFSGLTVALSQTQVTQTEQGQSISLHSRLLERIDDDAHTHPIEGDSAIEERLAELERLDLGARVFALDQGGNTLPVTHDYLNENWPGPRDDDALPISACSNPFPHDAHTWAQAVELAEDEVRLYCSGAPADAVEPDTQPDGWTPADPEVLEASDEDDPPTEEGSEPTTQQRAWLGELLQFHARGGGQVTAFMGGTASGKTWLMAQLRLRGYPDPAGAWREWAQRWALAPTPGGVLHVTTPLGSDMHTWVRRAIEGVAARHVRYAFTPTDAQRRFFEGYVEPIARQVAGEATRDLPSHLRAEFDSSLVLSHGNEAGGVRAVDPSGRRVRHVPLYVQTEASLREALRLEQRSHEETIRENSVTRRNLAEAQERADQAQVARDRRGRILVDIQKAATSDAPDDAVRIDRILGILNHNADDVNAGA